MIDLSWHLDDDPEPRERAASGSGVLSVDQLRSAVRRRRRVPIVLALLGGLLALAFALAVPGKSHATVTLLLAHPDGDDPETAMSTDVSLLETTTVARRVIADLRLDQTPHAFQRSFTATPTTSQVLAIDATGSGAADAVRRARTLATTFLAFRAEQLSDQSKAVVAGYQAQITALEKKSADLSAEYDQLTAAGSADQDRAADVLDQRAKIDGQVNTLQASMQDAGLQTTSVVRASHVVDPATAQPSSRIVRTGLTTVSGIAGGLAVGLLVVLLGALTTRRLRSRREVADALGAPVRTTTGPVRRSLLARLGSHLPRPRLRRRLAGRDGAVGDAAVDVLAAGLGSAVSPSRRAINRIALAAVDDVETAARVVTRLALDRTARGDQVFLVDLTSTGLLAGVVDAAVAWTDDDVVRATPLVYRPDHAPELARGPVGEDDELAGDLLPTSPFRRAFDRSDLVLSLVEAGPAAELGMLHTWADQQVALVTAGVSSEERLRTTGALLHDSGVDLRFCLLAGVDGSDESLGLDDPTPVAPASPGTRRHRR